MLRETRRKLDISLLVNDSSLVLGMCLIFLLALLRSSLELLSGYLLASGRYIKISVTVCFISGFLFESLDRNRSGVTKSENIPYREAHTEEEIMKCPSKVVMVPVSPT